MVVVDREARASLHLWIALNRTTTRLHEPLRRQVETHELTLTEFGVLEALLHNGPLPHGDIADRVLLANSSITYVIDKLEERGLLRRRQSDEDRRQTLAALTSAGRAKIEAVFPEHAALIDDLMADLSLEEKRTAASVLRRVERSASERDAPSSSD
jgi:MarR family 2-MHQ and catechol resistance regulon transcriptional repressor